MAFGTDIHMEKADEGEIRGTQEEIAVGCWFTSRGDTSLKMMKYQDDTGEIHTIYQIKVLYKTRKNYNGIPTLEYVCLIEENGKQRRIKLIFFLEEHRWVMIRTTPVPGSGKYTNVI